jgi:CRP-like cAMP-binding protein
MKETVMPLLDLAALFDRDERVMSYAAGEAIFQRDELGKTMYVVLEGEINIVLHGNILETVRRGGIFGELALIDNRPRSASAVAATACRLTAIDERRFLFLTQQTPHFALHVMTVLAERLRRKDP